MILDRLDRVTIMCFAASYVVALVLGLGHVLQPRAVLRWLSLGAGGAGLLAHTLFLAMHNCPCRRATVRCYSLPGSSSFSSSMPHFITARSPGPCSSCRWSLA